MFVYMNIYEQKTGKKSINLLENLTQSGNAVRNTHIHAHKYTHERTKTHTHTHTHLKFTE